MHPSLEDVMLLVNGWMKEKKTIDGLLFRGTFIRSVVRGLVVGTAQNVVVINSADKISGMILDLRQAAEFSYADQREFGDRGKDYTDVVQGSLQGDLHFAIVVRNVGAQT